jgi:hypothetical protein
MKKPQMHADEHRLEKEKIHHEGTKSLRKFKLYPSYVFVPL